MRPVNVSSAVEPSWHGPHAVSAAAPVVDQRCLLVEARQCPGVPVRNDHAGAKVHERLEAVLQQLTAARERLVVAEDTDYDVAPGDGLARLRTGFMRLPVDPALHLRFRTERPACLLDDHEVDRLLGLVFGTEQGLAITASAAEADEYAGATRSGAGRGA